MAILKFQNSNDKFQINSKTQILKSKHAVSGFGHSIFGFGACLAAGRRVCDSGFLPFIHSPNTQYPIPNTISFQKLLLPFRPGQEAGLRLAEPAIPVPGDKPIEGIPQGAGNDQEDPCQVPEPAQCSQQGDRRR